MNHVILPYSRLPRQLTADLRARWRARLPYGRALQLSAEPRAQSRTLLGIALACRTLSAAAGREVHPGELRYSAQGKPQVPGLPEFSIAHAGAWVLCAVASAGAVGVDVEPVVAASRLLRWTRIFDATERAAMRSTRAALATWTAKEAVLKAAGATLADLPWARVRGAHVEFRGQRWYRLEPRLSARVVACLVTARPVARLSLSALSQAAVLAA
jgi:4'-phosphopantetheinyl transferase